MSLSLHEFELALSQQILIFFSITSFQIHLMKKHVDVVLLRLLRYWDKNNTNHIQHRDSQISFQRGRFDCFYTRVLCTPIF